MNIVFQNCGVLCVNNKFKVESLKLLDYLKLSLACRYLINNVITNIEAKAFEGLSQVTKLYVRNHTVSQRSSLVT